MDQTMIDTKLIFESPEGIAKGTILLIHGTGPQKIDGQMALPETHEWIKSLKNKDPHHYVISPTYKELAHKLNQLGWNTVRYTRIGVSEQGIDFEKYGLTDLNNVVTQLKDIWNKMPGDKPKIIFAWSGGSVHALQLPLNEASAVILLGGIATKRTDIAKLRAKNAEDLKKINSQLQEIISMEGKVSRTEMLGADMPFGRFFDENNLQDNWTYLKKYQNLPTLILHGDSDLEADVSQARIWKDKLPNNNITTIIKKGGNHMYGTNGNHPDVVSLAETINEWLSNSVK